MGAQHSLTSSIAIQYWVSSFSMSITFTTGELVHIFP